MAILPNWCKDFGSTMDRDKDPDAFGRLCLRMAVGTASWRMPNGTEKDEKQKVEVIG